MVRIAFLATQLNLELFLVLHAYVKRDITNQQAIFVQLAISHALHVTQQHQTHV
jgi:hypothetical protein